MFDSIFDIFINIDKYAADIVSEYHMWTYAILFVVIYLMIYNVIGAALWTALFCYGGRLFGDIPFVQKKMEFLIILIMISHHFFHLIEFIKAKYPSKK